MKNILITDTHFGCKNNSIPFFKKQIEFFYNTLIPYIKNCEDDVEIYHLGDLFDNRSTVSVYIASKVRELFLDLTSICKAVHVMAGNHDFVQQTSTQENYNSVDLILGGVVDVIDKRPVFVNDALMFDYNSFQDREMVIDTVNKFKPKVIMCHDDIFALPKDILDEFKDVKVFAGHIHQSRIEGNLWNLGATSAKDFSDANDPKYAYVFDENWDFVEKIENNDSVKFIRLYEDDIKKVDVKKMKSCDNVEVYLPKEKILTESYKDQMKVINEHFDVISTISIEEPVKEEDDDPIDIEEFNIEKLIESKIPSDCLDIYKEVIHKQE